MQATRTSSICCSCVQCGLLFSASHLYVHAACLATTFSLCVHALSNHCGNTLTTYSASAAAV